MNFVMGLLLSTTKKNAIWVIVDRINKSAHFLPIRDTWNVEKLAQLYVKEIVRLHRISANIMFDKDQRFQAFFLLALQQVFGTKLNFSNSSHHKIDGQTKRVNQILEDMLRACVLEFQGKWEDDLPLVEFSYNNSYQSTIKTAPFKALYERKCQTPLS